MTSGQIIATPIACLVGVEDFSTPVASSVGNSTLEIRILAKTPFSHV